MKYDLFVCAFLLGAAAGAGRAQTVPTQPVSSLTKVASSAAVADPTTDARLRGEVVLRVKWARLEAVAGALAEQTRVPVEAAPKISGRRVNLFSLPPSASAGQNMAVIARAAGLTWEVVDANAKDGYRLTLSIEQRAAEEKAKRNSERREEKARAANRAALLRSLKDEIRRGGKKGQAGFGDYLSAFSDQQLAEAADSAQDHVEVISAGDQRHFYPFFLGSRPFSQLSRATQQTIRDLTTRDEYLPGAPTSSPPPGRTRSRGASSARCRGRRLP